MIVYKDIISGDELFTDTFPMQVVGDVFYKVKCKMTSEKVSNDYNTGANASAEEAADDLEEKANSGLDVALQCRLTEPAPFNKKKEYLLYLKEYINRLKEKISAEDHAVLKEKLQPAMTELMANFKKLDMYQGESADPDAMIALVNWEEDETVPYMYFFKQGAIAEKF